MSNVTLKIAGRSYTIACAEGEESHITMLGATIDGKLSAMSGVANQTEPRTLLFAALLLADELHEAKKTTQAPQSVPQTAPQPALNIAQPLENMADRLESLASRLEAEAASS